MPKAVRQKTVKKDDVRKHLAIVDKLFRSIENDKSLPTFGGFFMECIILGIEDNVNLRKMYPEVYKKLYSFLIKHRSGILSVRK